MALLVVLFMGFGGAASAQKRIPTSQVDIQLSFAPLVKRVAPAVVNIFTTKTITARRVSPLFDDPFFRRFFGDNFAGPQRQRKENSLGSGVIVQPDGLIITNHHVVQGADEIRVILADRREFRAVIVGSDEKTDLAVLRINTGGQTLPHLTFRDSDDLEVGDLVLAIGNPFGVGQTVTSGIVSALARTQVGINDLSFFIQTDAAINPGNSGGALVTMDGKLVGINSAIFSKSGGSIGIGFAIPANMVRTVMTGLTGGQLVRPWLGGAGQAVSSDIANSIGLDRPAGVLINSIYPNGPADRAGLGVGDVVLAVNSREVNDPEALRFRIASRLVGESVRFRVWRQGRVRNVRFPVEAPPEIPKRDTTELSGAHPLQGATVANLSPALADEMGVDILKTGVAITEIRRASPAHRLNFRPGDIVRGVNGSETGSVQELQRVLVRQATRWRLAVERDGNVHSVVINR